MLLLSSIQNSSDQISMVLRDNKPSYQLAGTSNGSTQACLSCMSWQTDGCAVMFNFNSTDSKTPLYSELEGLVGREPLCMPNVGEIDSIGVVNLNHNTMASSGKSSLFDWDGTSCKAICY